jgi:hypothetical protein
MFYDTHDTFYYVTSNVSHYVTSRHQGWVVLLAQFSSAISHIHCTCT